MLVNYAEILAGSHRHIRIANMRTFIYDIRHTVRNCFSANTQPIITLHCNYVEHRLASTSMTLCVCVIKRICIESKNYRLIRIVFFYCCVKPRAE